MPEAIERLAAANIRFWVLTSDKQARRRLGFIVQGLGVCWAAPP